MGYYVDVSILVEVIILVLFPLMSVSVCPLGPVFVMVHIRGIDEYRCRVEM